MTVWILVATLIVVWAWGQYWYTLAHRITDIVNEILKDEENEE